MSNRDLISKMNQFDEIIDKGTRSASAEIQEDGSDLGSRGHTW